MSRPINQLLELMLDNQQYFRYGLCQWAETLLYFNKITKYEHEELFNYIKEKRPNRFSSVNCFIHSFGSFYWKKCEIEFRVAWLKEHIKLTSK